METTTDRSLDPRHIALILDGNGRWAEQHGLPRVEGHRKGAEAVASLLHNIEKYQVKYLTLYAFSTENWKRSPEEVNALMSLLCEFIDLNLDQMVEKRLRLRVTGRMSGLPQECQDRLTAAMKKTAVSYERTLILALNYGGRTELLDAIHKICDRVRYEELIPDEIDEKMIQESLYLPDVPDPDLMIRTSGEMRISNFLLWQLSYSELYFTKTLWPDFDDVELEKAIMEYQHRNRRFGGRTK